MEDKFLLLSDGVAVVIPPNCVSHISDFENANLVPFSSGLVLAADMGSKYALHFPDLVVNHLLDTSGFVHFYQGGEEVLQIYLGSVEIGRDILLEARGAIRALYHQQSVSETMDNRSVLLAQI